MLSCVWVFTTPWTTAHQAPLSSTISQRNLLRFISVESVMLTNCLTLYCPLFLLPSIFPGLGFFPISLIFASGGQSVGVSASASILPMNIQGWFPLGLIFLLSKGLSRVFSNTIIRKHKFFGTQPSLCSNSHIHTWLLEKPWLWLYRSLSQSDVSVWDSF